MRLYREFSSRDSASVRTPRNPTALTVATSTLAGAAIESPTAVNDGATGRYYVDTADALYTPSTVYRIAWTATILGSTFTRTLRFRHITASTADTTPPGPPTIGQPIVSSSSAIFPHTPPSDADYSSTTIFCLPVNGGTDCTGSGSGSTITVGLLAATTYIAIGVAYDTSGNASLPSNAILFTTFQSTSIAKPWYLKLFVNEEDTQHSNGPWLFNPTANKGVLEAGSDLAPMAQGLNCRFRLECHHGVWKPLLSLSVRWIDSATPPFGLINRRENR